MLALPVSLLPPVAHAAQDDEPVLVALFDFDEGTPDPAAVHPAFEVGPMSVKRGAVNFFAGNPGLAMATTQWHEDDNYFEFFLDPPSEGVTLTEFRFDERASATGPKQWTLSILDDLEGPGGPVESEVGTGDVIGTSFTRNPVELTDPSLRTELFGLRLRGFDASGSTGTWRIDNVTVTAAARAVVRRAAHDHRGLRRGRQRVRARQGHHRDCERRRRRLRLHGRPGGS